MLFCINFWALRYIVQAEVIHHVTEPLENETNPVTFNCQAIGEPLPNITWQFNDIMINVSDATKYNVSYTLNETVVTSLFTIINTQSSDVGTYSCFAENIIGSDQRSVVLTVNGKWICKLLVHYVVSLYNFRCCCNPWTIRKNSFNWGRE